MARAQYSQMIATRHTSERRAAAARANGAKSRGPVTSQGKANSSRNSFRHGLRSETLFADPASQADRIATLDSFMHQHQPQSQSEQALVKTIALSHWLRACIWKLEKSLMEEEMRRLRALVPDGNSEVTLASAFRSLADRSCALQFLNRLESRLDRQYFQTINRLSELHARPDNLIDEPDIDEQTQQVIESNGTPIDTADEITIRELTSRQPDPACNPTQEKLNVYERTQQVVENNPLVLKANP